MHLRSFFIALGFLSIFGFGHAAAQSAGGVTGRVIDASGGLPVPNASVQLLTGSTVAAKTATDASGSFTIAGAAPGSYALQVTAAGYQPSQLQVSVAPGSFSQVQVAVQRATAGTLREISHVSAAARSTLQASTTINQHLDPSIVQSQNYARIGDALIAVPGVTTYTGSSIGDDLGISIHGFDTSETATLLDGHPIGPIGAFSGGFDYQVSPFIGLSNVDVIFGSGATGIYGAPTIAGAVNFLTIDPTQQPHAQFTQGFGDNAKELSTAQATGTYGKLGYAMAWGVQGTYGNFGPQYITQTGLLGTDIRASNIAANTYVVTADYLQRDGVGKLTYSPDPKTTLGLTFYDATSWDDKSGNGDNDYNPYDYTLYNAQNTIAAGPTQVTLPNGSTATCNNSIAVLADVPAGYLCQSAAQYAQTHYGPSGGGPSPWQAIRNQDYHARFQRQIGATQLNVDGFLDHYARDYNRNVAGGGYNTDFYDTSGYLIGDEFSVGKHDMGAGYYYQGQRHTGDIFPAVDIFGNITNVQTTTPVLNLASSNVYVRDEYHPSFKFSVFGNIWYQHFTTTQSNQFTPRISLVYRPDGADVARLTGGRSYSQPDPGLLFSLPSFNTTPQNINPVCGPGDLNSIGSVSNPNLVPESASDLEFAYGHRFASQTVVQADVYTSYERNALFGGDLPLSALGQTQVPQSLINQYLARIAAACGPGATEANLAVSTTYNAAAARYQGIDLSISSNPLPHLTVTGEYGVQSAVFLGVPVSILQSNTTIINGSQIAGVPLRKGNAGLSYDNRGLGLSIQGNYISANNPFNRPAFWFANASISKSVSNVTFALSANNLFNSAAQIYGYFGHGLFVPENQYGSDTNAFQQGTEEFGLPPGQYFFTISDRI
ncbi:MAG TPA: TonB-dependent receptor [Candidatus Baltobacteraceae bacterium]|nr:TonB-dependent receptor [Candidatus Baltobacteraceae bacterium]